MANPLLVFEDVATVAKRRVGQVWGVPFYVTPWGWLSVPLMLVGGVGLGILGDALGLIDDGLGRGFTYGLALILTNFVHSFGHILGGKLVGAPMSGNLITMTRQVNLYTDTQAYTSRVHLARAIGGPFLNIAVGGVAWLVGVITGWDAFFALGAFNLAFGIGSFAPIPSVDGEVIFRELRK